jgi:hypothetical protein
MDNWLHGAESLRSLTGPQLVKKSPAFYGTQRFIIAFTRAHHQFLSWAISTQYMPPPPPFHILKIRFNIILPSVLGGML